MPVISWSRFLGTMSPSSRNHRTDVTHGWSNEHPARAARTGPPPPLGLLDFTPGSPGSTSVFMDPGFQFLNRVVQTMDCPPPSYPSPSRSIRISLGSAPCWVPRHRGPPEHRSSRAAPVANLEATLQQGGARLDVRSGSRGGGHERLDPRHAHHLSFVVRIQRRPDPMLLWALERIVDFKVVAGLAGGDVPTTFSIS